MTDNCWCMSDSFSSCFSSFFWCVWGEGYTSNVFFILREVILGGDWVKACWGWNWQVPWPQLIHSIDYKPSCIFLCLLWAPPLALPSITLRVSSPCNYSGRLSVCWIPIQNNNPEQSVREWDTLGQIKYPQLMRESQRGQCWGGPFNCLIHCTTEVGLVRLAHPLMVYSSSKDLLPCAGLGPKRQLWNSSRILLIAANSSFLSFASLSAILTQQVDSIWTQCWLAQIW